MPAELGLSFGSVALDYARGRPGWPAAAVDVLGLPVDAHVLDLAAGTGKLTELLAARFARVTAVEPDAEMRAANSWGEVLEGTAEAIPLEAGAADAVFVAEAFHWFAGSPALRELERVLRPGGGLVLLWNRPREESAIPAEVHELMERLSNDAGRTLKQRWPTRRQRDLESAGRVTRSGLMLSVSRRSSCDSRRGTAYHRLRRNRSR